MFPPSLLCIRSKNYYKYIPQHIHMLNDFMLPCKIKFKMQKNSVFLEDILVTE